MEVVCDNCEAKLNVPAERIPEDKPAFVKCPRCRSRLNVSSGAGPGDDPPGESVRAAETGSNPGGEDIQASEVDDSFLEFFEDGGRLALVLEHNPGDVEKIKDAVEYLGYRYVAAENTRSAVGKMRLHHFDLIILSDHFDDMELSQSPVLQYLNNLSMSIRRHVFLVLVSDEYRTLDPMMAFAMSANLVVGRKDLDKMTAILKQAVSDNQRFYKVFMDTLAEVGKV